MPINLVKSAFRKLSGRNALGVLDILERRIQKRNKQTSINKLKVLIGPSFAIWSPCFALDRSLSLALQARGVDVIPMYCDGIQDVECNYVGGDWTAGAVFSESCKNCKKTSEKLWRCSPNAPLLLSRFISSRDVEDIKAKVSQLDYEDAICYEESGVAYGAMAKDIMVNNYLVATPSLIANYTELVRVHLRNLLLVSVAYERVLDELKPDRVVSNDSYYGMWAVLQKHCISRSIPFYSHWPVTNDRAAFAYNDAAMNLDFKKSWDNFSRKDLSPEDDARIDKWLAGGRGLVIDTTKLVGHEVYDPVVERINPHKATIVLAANVIWDLAALNKQLVFEDMIAWVVETIKWFVDKPEYQLIIRPHPVETSPKIPKTRETVAAALKTYGIVLPANVFLLQSEAKITLKDLFSSCDVRGVAVHTSTVGFEYPAQGVPVVTTAKSPYRGFGFTIDPVDKGQYFEALSKILSGERKGVTLQSQTLARKFVKFYQFHYYARHGLFVGNPPELSESYLEILEEKNGPFGFVINSIIDGLPINGEDTWLPES